MRRLALFLAVTLTAPSVRPAAAALDRGVVYRPPVDGPVVDEFRPPPRRWQAGNRGIDYRTEPGGAVRAAADGEVVFAGQVGGRRHVVVLHADGIRTSYSFLQTTTVRRGDRVRGGQVVGTSGPTLHFGARVGTTYIDPRLLFGPPPSVHLVPDEARGPAAEADERAAVAAIRPRAAPPPPGPPPLPPPPPPASPAAGPERAVGLWSTLWRHGRELAPATRARRLAAAVGEWARQRRDCTPPGQPPPPLPERRMAVLVGGLGSSSTDAAVDDVDTGALGYRPADVARFSYRGGTVAEQAYRPTDTTVDLRHSARRLADLLREIGARHPGVPVDLLAHSQGGLVARQALAFEYDNADGSLPPVATLVTLGTPHQGADLATALALVGTTEAGRAVQSGLRRLAPAAPDSRGPSLGQLAEGSDFLRRLNRRSLPPGVRATSIGARADLIVPSRRTRYRGARAAVVGVPGLLTDHDALPGSAAAHREIALAVAGRPPTCRSLPGMLADTALSDAIGVAEDALGAGLWAGAGTLSGRPPRVVR